MGGDAERERDGGTSEGDGGIIRSAGFGNVLYVDPREVYLTPNIQGFSTRGEEKNLPLIIKRAIANSQPSQKIPDVCIAPIDNGINALKVGPTLIRLCAMRKVSY